LCVLAAGGLQAVNSDLALSQCNHCGLSARFGTQFGEDVADVDLHGVDADVQLVRDLPVGGPGGHQLENLALPAAKGFAELCHQLLFLDYDYSIGAVCD
jgi:hypothetical protein